MKKRGVVILFLILLVSGCVEQQVETSLEKKVSKSILEQRISLWAKNPDGTANFTVIFTKDTSFSDAVAIIKKHGGYYRDNVEGVPVTPSNWHNNLTVIIDEDNILNLASEDKVKWVDEVPSPPEIYQNNQKW